MPPIAQRLARDPFMLAPMAGVTDAAFREFNISYGCPLCYTEMVSVAGVAYSSAKTWDLIMPGDNEPQVAVQLFGSIPDQFERAAAQIVDRLQDRLALLDINMACPVPKVTRKGEGSALMGTPELAGECLAATVRGAQGIPVTCKIRAGLRSDAINAPEFARMLEQSGADAIAVHGRTATQLYTGKADWDVVARVARCVTVPVIGSGDVYTPQDACGHMRDHGCSGIFIARGSYGNPWLFRRAKSLLETGVVPDEPTLAERLEAARRHILTFARFGCHLVRLRPAVGWYVKGLPAASQWRDRSMRCETVEDYLGLVDDMEQACRDHGML